MGEGESPGFGHQLRRLRETARLTQEELAERAGISVKAISALERGRRQRPYPNTVRALADALGLSEEGRAVLAAAIPSRESAPATTRTNLPRLPIPPTPLIGRERELDEIANLLRTGSARMITLTGAGGVGKTRLALELASNLGDAFPGGVGFVPLASLGDPGLVLPTVAQTLGLAEASHATASEALAASFGDQAWLLVLDNFEHVLDVAPDVASLLAACPGLSILVTSRASLRIRAEHEYPVRPLALPDLHRVPTPCDLAHVSAVQLFLERAQAAAPAFDLTPANSAAVAAICRRLDGLPLALELVAARVRVLGPTELLARLDHLLPLLVGGSRDLPQRQQTMWAAIDWSYELLSPAEQLLFRHLAVFAGGWTLEAAEAVGPDGAGASEVIDLLGALVEQSLVTVTYEDFGTRYGMLEPVRQFAQERLEAHGEVEETRRRHAAFYLTVAEQSALEFEGRPGQVSWLERLEREHDNLRSALTWSAQAPDGPEIGLRLATALWRFWEVRWHVGEGSAWLAGALARSDGLPPALRARALNVAGNLSRDRADHERATAYHEQSLAIWRELGDRRGIARSLNNLGVIARDRGDAELTMRLCHESLMLFREIGDRHGAAIALISLGIAAGQQGEYEQGRSYFGESLALFRASGDSWHIAWVMNYLADLVIRQGDFATARQIAAESLALHRAASDAWGIAGALGVLGRVAQADDDLGTAARQFAEGLRLVVGAGVERAIPDSLEDLAGIVLAWRQPDRAARLAGAAEALRGLIGITHSPGDGTAGAVDLTGLRAGPQAAAWSEGKALTREQIIGEALALADCITSVPVSQSREC